MANAATVQTEIVSFQSTATPASDVEQAAIAETPRTAEIIPFESYARPVAQPRKSASELAVGGFSMLIMGFVFLFIGFLVFAGCQILYTAFRFTTGS